MELLLQTPVTGGMHCSTDPASDRWCFNYETLDKVNVKLQHRNIFCPHRNLYAISVSHKSKYAAIYVDIQCKISTYEDYFRCNVDHYMCDKRHMYDKPSHIELTKSVYDPDDKRYDCSIDIHMVGALIYQMAQYYDKISMAYVITDIKLAMLCPTRFYTKSHSAKRLTIICSWRAGFLRRGTRPDVPSCITNEVYKLVSH